jgi:hypothetical protein
MVICLATFVSFYNCAEDKADRSLNFPSDQKDSSINITTQLEGVWGMTHYFDSVLAHKEVAKFRVQEATWFSILIQIDSDSVYHFGSIFDGSASRKMSDTLTLIESMGAKWVLLNRLPELHLIQISTDYGTPDSNCYIFRKRDDLAYMLETETKYRLKLDSAITTYFNEALIAGNYTNGHSSVTFSADGTVSGFADYTHYQVRNYFGTLHPFNNLDVILFENATLSDYWSWNFEANELILIKLKPDWETTDAYWPTNESIRLKTSQ